MSILQGIAPAKINLGLHVLRKRDDGYHDLETVFLRIGWHDRLTVRRAPVLRLTCSDPTLPTDAGNLCWRAAQHLQEAFSVEAGAALHLEKHLPYGAGLGGGSSDAATTLRLLVDLWEIPATEADLHTLAAALGSDVPFFLGPEAAYGTGRGEVLTPLVDAAGQAYAFPFSLVVVVPSVHVSTAEAYAGIRPNAAARPDLQALVASNDPARWQAALVNDFEAPIFARYPALGSLKAMLEAAGAGYAAMSGSGSAVFGVFEERAAAIAAAEAARLQGYTTWVG